MAQLDNNVVMSVSDASDDTEVIYDTIVIDETKVDEALQQMRDDFDVFNVFPDYEPSMAKDYFLKDQKPQQAFDMISVLIPTYNETATELQRTLVDLHRCAIEMNKIGGGCINVLIVLDGWKVAHPTTKAYIKKMFPGVRAEIDGILARQSEVETYVIQKVTYDNKITYVNITEDRCLKITVLVKLDNRRKHNSHAWFLNSYAVEMDSDYVFLTDCGTKFKRNCLINLYRGIRYDTSCSAISGKQRVMTAEQQGNTDGVRGYLYRAMQCFDYEVSLACFTGPFSTFGMLPVIPGPCGLYRFDAICNKKTRSILKRSHINDVEVQVADEDVENIKYIKVQGQDYIDANDFYIKTVSVNPDESGMLMGCLLLAEDRVLSYAATLVTDKTYHTKYEPKAIFYFEAETDPTQLLQQRRRWINGTVAGYLWLLMRISIMFNSKMRLYEKLSLTFLVFTQLMMFVIIALGVPIITIGIRFNIQTLYEFKKIYVEGFIGLYVLLYVVFVMTHSSPKRKLKLNVFLFDLITLMNMIVIGLLMACIGLYVWNLDFSINVIMILGNIAMPFILALLHDWTSFVLMIKTFIPFMLLLITFTVFFCVYSFSRLWELTWGNRPSTKLLTFETTLSQAEKENIKRRQEHNALAVAWTFVGINVLLCAFFYTYRFNNMHIIIFQASLFVWAFMQMILSLLYFIVYNTRQILVFIFRFLTCRLNRKKTEFNDKFGRKNEVCKTIIRTTDAHLRCYRVRAV